MSVALESTLIMQMSATYNTHFIQSANAGEALTHMMKICSSLHPKLRAIKPQEILVLLSHGKSFNTRAQLRDFAIDVIVFLVADVVGSNYSHTEIVEAVSQKITR